MLKATTSTLSKYAGWLTWTWTGKGVLVLALVSLALVLPVAGWSNEPAALLDEKSPPVPERVGVAEVSSDQAIARRLQAILQATGRFENVQVDVRNGVVFLSGQASQEGHRGWAEDLAHKTEDVVAVVNRIKVTERSPWDFSPALEELQGLVERAIQRLPVIGIALLILILAAFSAKFVAAAARRALDSRLSPLLRDVAAKAISIPIFILGCYLVLKVAGLTRLATTVLGGTGLVGLVAGIAFRDILENFLASILISMRNPFNPGDLVEISGHLGVVQRVTSRGTVLMDADGNHIQIPNAVVYKNIIRNYTANPNRRETFTVGIGFDNETATAQELALNLLLEHPAVLKDPQPLVLVEQLGSATVNLRIYFWYDGAKHNGLKVKSALIRLVKRRFEEEQISMPDEAREIVFPDGVPVSMHEAAPAAEQATAARPAPPESAEPEAIATAAEGELANEEKQLEEQARKARNPEAGSDLLQGPHAG